MTILTIDRLKAAGACIPQLAQFVSTFGSSVEVTEELCVSVAGLFKWEWAAENLLSHKGMTEYHVVCFAAYAEYMKECDRVEYNEVRAAAMVEYDKVCATARDGKVYVAAHVKYMEVRDAAWEDYCTVCRTAKVAYLKVCAAAFGRLYNLGA